MISFSYTLTIILVVAGVTLLTRALPFILFPGDKALPPFIHYLGQVLPFAVMGMLVVYCLKDVSVLSAPYGIPELVSILAVVFLHRTKHNLALSIGGGTLLYMLFVQVIFA